MLDFIYFINKHQNDLIREKILHKKNFLLINFCPLTWQEFNVMKSNFIDQKLQTNKLIFNTLSGIDLLAFKCNKYGEK